MKYWLMKTEPGSFSWDDLVHQKTTQWEGVRNYQARNFMRDDMKKGDLVFIYHSVVKPMAIMGVAQISAEAYGDPFALDPDSRYFDPKSTKENNRWVVVDVKVKKQIDPPITLEELKQTPGLESMVLLQKGSRLSIQPVTEKEWKIILNLRNINL